MNGNAVTNGHTNGHTNGNTVNGTTTTSGSPTSDEEHIRQFWNRFEATKHGDNLKNTLLADVLTRYDYLMRKHQAYIEEHKQERELAQQAIEREQRWYGHAMHLQRILVSTFPLLSLWMSEPLTGCLSRIAIHTSWF